MSTKLIVNNININEHKINYPVCFFGQLGNPETSYAEDWLGMVDYAWSHAVISDETYKKIRRNCDFNSSDPWKNEECTQGVDEVLKQYNEIDIYSLYTSVCFASTARSNDRSMKMTMNHSPLMVSHEKNIS
jgi:serine carboxypeptidase-like clade 2